MQNTFRLLILFLVVLGCKDRFEAPARDFQDASWVVFMNRFPGGDPSLSKKDAAAFVARSVDLSRQATALHQQKKFAEATQTWERAIEQHATAETYYGYANSLTETDLKKSIRAYELALTLSYQQPEIVFYNIACAYSRLNDTDNAIQYLRLAISRGYNAFAHIEKDPDLANLRKLTDWETRLRNIQEDRIESNELVGGIGRWLPPRTGSTYILCKNGIFLETGTDMCGPGYLRGKWGVENGDLVFEVAESCIPRAEVVRNEHGMPVSIGGGGCLGSKYFYEPCSPSRGRKIQMRKDQIQGMRLPTSERRRETEKGGEYFDHKPLSKEPPQCDPAFVPKTVEDMRLPDPWHSN